MKQSIHALFNLVAGTTPTPPPPPPGPSPSPVGPPSEFKIAANVGGVVDYVEAQNNLVYIDQIRASRGFTTLAGKYGTPCPVDSNGWPTTDFCLVLPRVPISASAQVMKASVGCAATITVDGGYSITNKVTVGNQTTFDINIPASTPSNNVATLTFASTVNHTGGGGGADSLLIKAPGYALADSTKYFPSFISYLSRFTTLRFMDTNATNNNLTQILTTDRPSNSHIVSTSDTEAQGFVMSMEDAISMCNSAGTNMWWTLPVVASDALVTAYATLAKTSLNSSKYTIFELGNECWNDMFKQLGYCMDSAMNLVNGFSYQYGVNIPIVTATRTSNVTTVVFKYAHGRTTGDLGVVAGFGGTSSGVRTLTVVNSTTLSFPDTGTDGTIVQQYNTSVRMGRCIIDAVRASNVTTIRFGIDHGITNGATVGINSIGSVFGRVTATVINARTITIADVGADGPIGLGGGTSLVGSFLNALNSYDQAYDQFVLARRWQAKRTVEIANLISAVYGVDFNVKGKVCFFTQPGANCSDEMLYINTAHGTPSNYLYGIGLATYFFFDATPWGGPNLRNATTYNGNTPPSVADYVSVLNITGPGAWARDNYDRIAITARKHNLKLLQYEFGPDLTASPANSIPSIKANKLASIFDSTFKPVYRSILTAQEGWGFEEVALYSAGTSATTLTQPDEYNGWGIALGWDIPSPRTEAIDEHKVAARTGITRNLIAASGTTTILASNWAKDYQAQTPPPNMGGAMWNVTAPATKNYSLVLNYSTSSGSRNGAVYVNNVFVQNVTWVNGLNIDQSAVTIPMTIGTNVIEYRQTTDYLGNLVTPNSLKITPL